MSNAALDVLYEDNHLLAVAKPAGLATIGVAEHQPSLAKLVKKYLKGKYQKPGNVYLGVTSRLDAAVSGVILFARTSKAAARLMTQFHDHHVEKTYLAAVEGVIEPPSATLVDWVTKNEQQQRMEVVRQNFSGAKEARLSYRRLATTENTSLLEVRLETGRKHQIRLQLSSRSHAVVGDQKYGAERKFPVGIALHSARLVVEHPTQHTLLTIACPPPRTWRGLGFEKALQNWQ